ncbi:MAG: hypothetical protein IJ179_09870 [Oscillospiraceae bacterium]|nr:hypothetical protein [Oscillospiraceae bacterium]
MENGTRRDAQSLSCAMGYEITAQRVPGGGTLSLPVWEIHGEGIRQGEDGLLLDRGLYLVQFTGQVQNAGLVLTLNDAKLRHLEAPPAEKERRLTLQGLLSLTAPAVLRPMNNGEEEGVYCRTVMTILRLH